MPPAASSRGKVAHGSILSDNFGRCRVKSQWQSTVQARYGARPLTLNGTHNAIVVDSLTAVDTALELLIEATAAGELDAALAQVSSRSKRTDL